MFILFIALMLLLLLCCLPYRKQKEETFKTHMNSDNIVFGLDGRNVDVAKVPSFKPKMRKGVKPNESVVHLLRHERNRKVIFSQTEKCFRVNLTGVGEGRRYTGITNALGKVFWPNFDLKEARKRAIKDPERERLKRRRRQSRSQMNWEQIKRQTQVQRGMDLGSAVHQELEDYANMKFVEFREKYSMVGVNAYTVKVILMLHGLYLKPVYAEFPIFCERMGIATSVDLVCVSCIDGSLVFVEVKTCYEGYFIIDNGQRMAGPMRGLPCTPLNQARLQALFARLIVKKNYGITDADVVVIHAHEGGVSAHAIPPTFFHHEDQMYAYLISKRKRRRREGGGGRKKKIVQRRPTPRGSIYETYRYRPSTQYKKRRKNKF